jgi:hypothetical protein
MHAANYFQKNNENSFVGNETTYIFALPYRNGETVKSSLSDEEKPGNGSCFEENKKSEKQFGSLKLNFYLRTPLRNEGLPETATKVIKFFRYWGVEKVKEIVDSE